MRPDIPNYEDEKMIYFLKTQLEKIPPFPEGEDVNAVFLPERLVDVEASSLRLVDRNNITAGSARRPQYCALSYCWGPREDAETQTKTTTENLERHLERLDFEALSPVLKDAVTTARSLSIPYLWVDSLCILQDDVSDWRRQCSQMNNVYGNARVTLIAAVSRTCREGFLNPRRLSLRFPFQLMGRRHNDRSIEMYFTHALGELHPSQDSIPTSFPYLHYDLNFSQWARRGWTFQEEAMADTCIVFGNLDVYFGRTSINGYEYCTIHQASEITTRNSVTSLQSKDELHRAWDKVIRRYSAFTSSSFTNSTDVLPALSGLARLYGNKLQVEYLAGHWVDRLHCTLMWVRNSHRECPSMSSLIKGHRQKPYLIPSWSYLTRGIIASVLQYDTSGCRSELTILDIYKPTAGEDPYGALEDSNLTIKGFVLDLASLAWSQSQKRVVGSVGSQAAQIWFEESSFIPHRSQYNEFVIFDPNSGPRQPNACYHYHMELDFRLKSEDRYLLGEIHEPFHQLISRMTILLVGSERVFTDGTLECRHGYGLVLFRLDGASERLFLRVGTFHSHGATRENNLPSLKRLMKEETIKLS